jgi:hypothetical protein
MTDHVIVRHTALITTAYQTTRTGNTGQPSGSNSAFDVGAGHVNPTNMINPGLIFDASFEDYARYICATRTPSSMDLYLPIDILSVCRTCKLNAVDCNPLNLNMPSISAPLVVGFNRTVQRTGELASCEELLHYNLYRGCSLRDSLRQLQAVNLPQLQACHGGR